VNYTTRICNQHLTCCGLTVTSYNISYDIIWYHMTSYDIIWNHMTYNNAKLKNKLKINITCNQLSSRTLTPLQISTCRNFRWRLGCCGDNAQNDFISAKPNQEPCDRLVHQHPEVFFATVLMACCNFAIQLILTFSQVARIHPESFQYCGDDCSNRNCLRIVLATWIQHRNLSVKVLKGKSLSWFSLCNQKTP
jgi:hypothetical protein